MKTLLTLPLVLASLMSSFTSHAVCTNHPIAQPKQQFPNSIRGKLVFHTYKTYGDGTSNLFLQDFRENTLTQLNKPSWHIEDPMNAHFSPDGRYLVFMGKKNTQWNIFIWKVDSDDAPVNLSNNSEISEGRSEDPKFSADGNYVVYKHNKDINLIRLSFENPGEPSIAASWSITNNGDKVEESMPYFSGDGKAIYYSTGVDKNSAIYKINLNLVFDEITIEKPTVVAGRQNLAEYYPVTQNKQMYFTGWKNAGQKRDHIYMFNHMSGQRWQGPNELSLNDCNAENSDPIPVDDSNIIFSSTRDGKHYHLYLGNIHNGKVWSLDNNIGPNKHKHHLGATYTAVSYTF